MISTHVTDGEKLVYCTLCPHGCNLTNQWGCCGVRGPKAEYLSQISGIHIDPIEKKPIFHLNPNHQVLSVGFFGCNMHCMFCQNSHLLKRPSTSQKEITLESVKAMLIDLPKSIGLALTYSEPLIHFEVAMDLLSFAKAQGRFTVVVTNGLINPEPLKLLLPVIDGMNIDLKAPNQELYNRLGGNLSAVLGTIDMANRSCHVEVTSLIVTDFNDIPDLWDSIFVTLANINPDLVLHLSRYYPAHNYAKEATSLEVMQVFYQRAKNYLSHVYLGNVHTWINETRCTKCRTLLVSRSVYETHLYHMACPKCKSTRLIRF